jgi:hypothetical protein
MCVVLCNKVVSYFTNVIVHPHPNPPPSGGREVLRIPSPLVGEG